MKKKEKLLREIGSIDEKYIEEADPTKIRRKKKAKLYRMSALAACIAILAVSMSLWLFAPFNTDPPDVSKYADSEYYEIIEKLNTVTYMKPEDKNNFEKYIVDFFDGMFLAKAESDNASGMDGMNPGEAMTTSGTAEYVEVTDNQVQGVIEGDLFKRTKDRVFYLDGYILKVFSIEGEDSRELGQFNVYNLFQTAGFYYYNWGEMYLSSDGTMITLVFPYQINSKGPQVGVISLDVSDPGNITYKGMFSISGSYTSSRSLDGKLLLLSEFYVGRNPDFSVEENFLPQITVGDKKFSVPVENIVSPENLTSSRYTVVCELDQKTLELEGCTALLSYSNTVYVSLDSIYATRGYNDEIKDGNVTTRTSKTEISRISFEGEGFELIGSVILEGSVKDQYSLDEYNGMLRAVTTTSTIMIKETIFDDGNAIAEFVGAGVNGSNANLYVIDIDTMEILTSIEQFAPPGETVQSVRFDGNMGYVCTSIQLSDPVFFFDLTDIDNITVKDTGTIEGFSSSLVNFGDGFLLGIGKGNSWSSVKVEVYEESVNGVVSVDAYVVENGFYTENYKSHYINRDEKLVGLAITNYDNENERSRYVLLHFDNYALHVVESIPIYGSFERVRAFIEDGYLYVFFMDGFAVEHVNN